VFIRTFSSAKTLRISFYCVDPVENAGFYATVESTEKDRDTAMALADDLIKTAEFKKVKAESSP